MGVVIGVDVGGTFTDVFAFDPLSETSAVVKVPSTPPEFVGGFMTGIRSALAQLDGRSVADITRLIHGATIGTNAILTGTGARVGLLMTEGFRDVLYIGIGWRPKMYDLDMDAVEPLFLSDRRNAMVVRERVDHTGAVITALDQEDVRAAVRTLVEEQGVEVIVVCFLHAYANPTHERVTRDLIQGLYPGLGVSLSSDVLPRPREYHRLVATGFDGYVKPAMNRYVETLVASLADAGCTPRLQIMQSNGGISGTDAITERPIRTVLSGLAAGVLGAARAGANAGHPNCLSLDMGGTSADVALIRDGRPVITGKGSFEDWPLHLPMVEVRTIGAGGSSIAWLDPVGGMRVGPRSAGANPGPACYARGGLDPTVTDASFLLGYLNPESFAGGLELDLKRSEAAIRERIAEPLGMSLLAAALGIHSIVNTNMAQTLRLVSIKRGYDPRELTFIPLGGAGPVHGGRLAEEIGIRTMLIPPVPGVLSALGLMYAPTQHDALASFRMATAAASLQRIREQLTELDSACSKRMQQDGVEGSEVTVRYFAEMRYQGQSHELEVPLSYPLNPGSIEAAEEAFHALHQQTFRYASRGKATEITMLRTVHSASAASNSDFARPVNLGEAAPEPLRRPALFDLAKGFEDTPVWQRHSLPVGFTVEGPAVIEQGDTTTVIYPGHRLEVDALGNLLVTVP